MRFLERRSMVTMSAASILVAAFAGWVDDVTGMEISIALLYLVPIVLSAWFVGRWMGIIVSAQCAIEGFFAGMGNLSSYSHLAIPYWNAVMMLGFYVSVTLLLAALKDSLRHEEELARRIQQNLLPGTLDVSPATTIVSVWKPSTHVGGDYFDVFPLGSDRIGFCIADVAGHGIPAALLMSNVQSAVRLLASDCISSSDICARLNRQAFTNFPVSDFLTFFFGILHISTSRLTYSNAGHNPPIIIRSDGTVQMLSGGGVPLGIVPTWVYNEESVPVEAGDLILLYTDGVTEARNPAGELFGEERLIDVVLRNRSAGLEQIKTSVLETVESFSRGNADDDLTMLCIAFHGTGRESRQPSRP